MKFKVGDEAVFNCYYSENFQPGTIVKVIKIDQYNGESTTLYVENKDGITVSCFQHRLDKVKSKLNKKGRIKLLEETVTKQVEEIKELKLVICELITDTKSEKEVK